MTKTLMKDGQRVEVMLLRGEADVWYPGTVLDASTERVRLDNYPSSLGPPICEREDIWEWRPIGAYKTKEELWCLEQGMPIRTLG